MDRVVDSPRGKSLGKILRTFPPWKVLAEDSKSAAAVATTRRSTSSQNRVTSSNTYLLRQLRNKKALSHSFTSRHHTAAV
ncbi:hypothetical protein P5V15_012541 [Pogonomyrmex californicus]